MYVFDNIFHAGFITGNSEEQPIIGDNGDVTNDSGNDNFCGRRVTLLLISVYCDWSRLIGNFNLQPKPKRIPSPINAS